MCIYIYNKSQTCSGWLTVAVTGDDVFVDGDGNNEINGKMLTTGTRHIFSTHASGTHSKLDGHSSQQPSVS